MMFNEVIEQQISFSHQGFGYLCYGTKDIDKIGCYRIERKINNLIILK